MTRSLQQAWDDSRDALIARWKTCSGDERTALYVEAIAPRWIPLFRQAPIDRYPRETPLPCDVLISLLGMTWEPVLLIAAKLQPQKLVILATEKSAAKRIQGMSIHEVISQHSGLSVADIQVITVPMHAEIDIYETIREQRDTWQDKHFVIDLTGGLKSMSAAAALAGFVCDMPIVYVDSDVREGGVPVPGTEYSRLLGNPLEVLGDLEYRRIEHAFDAGRFTDAAIRSKDLAGRLIENRRADFYRLLCEAYGAWERFHFGDAVTGMHAVLQCAENLRKRRGGSPEIDRMLELSDIVQRQFPIVESMVMAHENSDWESGRNLILNYLAASDRRYEHGDLSAALLLIYAGIEKAVLLRLKNAYEICSQHTNWELIGGNVSDRYWSEYSKLIKGQVPHNSYLPERLSYANGIALLAALGDKGMCIDRHGDWLFGLSITRSCCELEHGLEAKPPEKRKVQVFRAKSEALIGSLLEIEGVEDQIKRLTFPRLSRTT